MVAKIGWAVAAALALVVIVSAARIAQGGSLDPPGPPSDTPLEAVLVPHNGRVIELANEVTLPAVSVPVATPTSEPTPTPTSTFEPPTLSRRFVEPISFGVRNDSSVRVPNVGGPAPQAAVSIDCDASTGAIDANCTYPSGTGSVTVAVVLTNLTASAFNVGTIGFSVIHLDDALLFAPSNTSAFDGNPDFTAAASTSDWNCGPPLPDNDLLDPVPGGAAPGQESFISCFNALGSGPAVAPGGNLRLATLRYNVLGGGAEPLTLRDVAISDSAFVERNSCNPGVSTPGPCNGATLQIEGPPAVTNTPTNTPTVTSTPVTPTPTVIGADTRPPPGALSLGFFDVKDCRGVTAFVEVHGTDGTNPEEVGLGHLELHGSADGAAPFIRLADLVAVGPLDGNTYRTAGTVLFDPLSPFVGAYAYRTDGSTGALLLSAWLYCT